MSDKPKDNRVAPTITLWIVALLMFIISIMPLSQAVERGDIIPLVNEAGAFIVIFAILPVLVLTASAVATYAIWRFGKPQEAQLPGQEVKQLQERVANLETIISYEEKTLRAKIDRLRSS